MSNPLSSQSSRRPNNSQRYGDGDGVVIVAHWRNCWGDCRWRRGSNPRGWDHCLRTAATEARRFPQIRWVILFECRYGGGFANDGDAVQPNTRRGGTAGSGVSEQDSERWTVIHVWAITPAIAKCGTRPCRPDQQGACAAALSGDAFSTHHPPMVILEWVSAITKRGTRPCRPDRQGARAAALSGVAFSTRHARTNILE